MTKQSKANLERSMKARYNWKHNSLIGTVALIRTHLKRLQNGKSVPTITKMKLTEIDAKLKAVDKDLRTLRVEPDGTLAEIGKKEDDQ